MLVHGAPEFREYLCTYLKTLWWKEEKWSFFPSYDHSEHTQVGLLPKLVNILSNSKKSESYSVWQNRNSGVLGMHDNTYSVKSLCHYEKFSLISFGYHMMENVNRIM